MTQLSKIAVVLIACLYIQTAKSDSKAAETFLYETVDLASLFDKANLKDHRAKQFFLFNLAYWRKARDPFSGDQRCQTYAFILEQVEGGAHILPFEEKQVPEAPLLWEEQPRQTSYINRRALDALNEFSVSGELTYKPTYLELFLGLSSMLDKLIDYDEDFVVNKVRTAHNDQNEVAKFSVDPYATDEQKAMAEQMVIDEGPVFPSPLTKTIKQRVIDGVNAMSAYLPSSERRSMAISKTLADRIQSVAKGVSNQIREQVVKLLDDRVSSNQVIRLVKKSRGSQFPPEVCSFDVVSYHVENAIILREHMKANKPLLLEVKYFRLKSDFSYGIHSNEEKYFRGYYVARGGRYHYHGPLAHGIASDTVVKFEARAHESFVDSWGEQNFWQQCKKMDPAALLFDTHEEFPRGAGSSGVYTVSEDSDSWGIFTDENASYEKEFRRRKPRTSEEVLSKIENLDFKGMAKVLATSKVKLVHVTREVIPDSHLEDPWPYEPIAFVEDLRPFFKTIVAVRRNPIYFAYNHNYIFLEDDPSAILACVDEVPGQGVFLTPLLKSGRKGSRSVIDRSRLSASPLLLRHAHQDDLAGPEVGQDANSRLSKRFPKLGVKTAPLVSTNKQIELQSPFGYHIRVDYSNNAPHEVEVFRWENGQIDILSASQSVIYSVFINGTAIGRFQSRAAQFGQVPREQMPEESTERVLSFGKDAHVTAVYREKGSRGQFLPTLEFLKKMLEDLVREVGPADLGEFEIEGIHNLVVVHPEKVASRGVDFPDVKRDQFFIKGDAGKDSAIYVRIAKSGMRKTFKFSGQKMIPVESQRAVLSQN